MFLQFPWVLKDYTSETLDLKNPDSYRDFTKPAGAMSANIESELQTRYDINSFNCIVTSKYINHGDAFHFSNVLKPMSRFKSRA